MINCLECLNRLCNVQSSFINPRIPLLGLDLVLYFDKVKLSNAFKITYEKRLAVCSCK